MAASFPLASAKTPRPLNRVSSIVEKSSSACAQAKPKATSESVGAYMCGTPQWSRKIKMESAVIPVFCPKATA